MSKRPWRVQYHREGETAWRTLVGFYYETEANAYRAIDDGWIAAWLGTSLSYRAIHIDVIDAAKAAS